MSEFAIAHPFLTALIVYIVMSGITRIVRIIVLKSDVVHSWGNFE